MTSISVQVPYPVFYDRDGLPLDNGDIYIGTANTDAFTNQIQVYYDEDLTITASQPLRTSGGYIYRNGTPVQVYVGASNFSISVRESNGVLVYNFPTATGVGVGAGGVSFVLGESYAAGSVGYFLNSFFDFPDSIFETTTVAGAGLQRGIAIEHYADAVGSYGLDIHQYQGAKNALVVHCYSDENGAVAGAVAVQIDHTRTGNILVLKNAENPVTSPGTKGTANFLSFVGYGGVGQTVAKELGALTHQMTFLSYDPLFPFTFNGGLVAVAGTGQAQAIKSTSLLDTLYAGEFYGTEKGIFVSTTKTNTGFNLGIVKNGAGSGTLMGMFNSGTGDFFIGYNGAAVEKSKIDSAGQYYVQGTRVISVQQAAVTAPAGGVTVDTQARTAINDVISRLQAHGLIAI